jgi:hypothetical protein
MTKSTPQARRFIRNIPRCLSSATFEARYTDQAMPDFPLKDLWTATGVILGFQMTLFKWRLEEENKVGQNGDVPWLVPSDYVSIVGMLSLVLGVILLPVAGLVGVNVARSAFGLGSLLFLGQALGLAGHYQTFNKRKKEYSFGLQPKKK